MDQNPFPRSNTMCFGSQSLHLRTRPRFVAALHSAAAWRTNRHWLTDWYTTTRDHLSQQAALRTLCIQYDSSINHFVLSVSIQIMIVPDTRSRFRIVLLVNLGKHSTDSRLTLRRWSHADAVGERVNTGVGNCRLTASHRCAMFTQKLPFVKLCSQRQEDTVRRCFRGFSLT